MHLGTVTLIRDQELLHGAALMRLLDVGEQRTSQILRRRLNLPLALATDMRFWQWPSMTRARGTVRWRWKKQRRDAVSEQRWLGGWKNTFRRLLLRANIGREDGADDPFALAGWGDEGFCVGIIRSTVEAVAPDLAELGLGADGPVGDRQRPMRVSWKGR
jgi:hypothetical protein